MKKSDSEMINNCRKRERPTNVKTLWQRMGPRPYGLTAPVLLVFQDRPYEVGIMWLPRQE